MILGIEIGGTKLQLGVGSGDDGRLAVLRRFEVRPESGAQGILRQLEEFGPQLVSEHKVTAAGVGFGGPICSETGRVETSHQIDGWDGYPLGSWLSDQLGIPVHVGNDCDVAALAESRLGAGRDKSSVLYVTVGTGIGGGLVYKGSLYGQDRPAVAELGHLRPGVHAENPESTVESVASGWGIVAAAQARLTGQIARPLDLLWSSSRSRDARVVRQRLEDAEQADRKDDRDLRNRCRGNLDDLTAKIIAEAAVDGNRLAAEVLQHAWQTLGWAIAQAITLTAPEVVVIGGGVSLIGERGFFMPVRKQVERFVFPPLRGSYEIVAAELGEETVVHGGVALAASKAQA